MVSEFSQRNGAVKTVQSHCKACQCHKYYQRTNRKRRKELYVVPGKVRQCSGSFCGGEIYPDTKEFFVKNGNSYYCKKCRSEYRKQPEQMEKAREYARKRYHQRKNEPAYRQVKNIRNRVNKVIKRLSLDQTYKGRKGNNIENIMGCKPQKLREHIENHPNFKPPLTWENYGRLWHLDHIRPVASFNLNDPIDFFTCFHYKNLRPCLSEENLRKRDKKTKLEEEPSFSHEDFRRILSRAKNVQNKGKEAGKVLLTLSST
jgi:ribosomal protein L24E